jgi:hypothetical protein
MPASCRSTAFLIVFFFLGAQWLAQTHRLDHNGSDWRQTGVVTTIASGADQWGHEKGTVECKLYDALSTADSIVCADFPFFETIAFPALFLSFLSAQVALRARRANARAPPRSV